MGARRYVRRASRIICFSLAILGFACSAENTTVSTDTNSVPDSVTPTTPPGIDLPDVVVTYSVLAAIVEELVEGHADVVTLIPDGLDPHDFEPSAKDVEAMNNAAIIVANGLDLEEGLTDALANTAESGTKVFYVADHVTTLAVVDVNDHSDHGHSHAGADSSSDSDHEHGTDPHIWLSAHTLREALPELGLALSSALSVDLADRTTEFDAQLLDLDDEIVEKFASLTKCQLVTGHNELAYFANRYGCKVIAAVLSSPSTHAEATASNIEFVIDVVKTHDAKVVFTSMGTNPALAEQVARGAGATVVEINTHFLGSSTTYAEFLLNLADTIESNLR